MRSPDIRQPSVPDEPERADWYEAVAAHYYDAALHPTCAAFRAASLDLLRALVPASPVEGAVVELGAGRASVPEVVGWWRQRPTLLLDASPTMLAHSRAWLGHGATGVVADARHTGLEDASAGLIVASLADPYNDAALWREIRRLLHPDGWVVMTTPSFAWAGEFRPGGQAATFDRAEFGAPDGSVHALPSLILARERQIALMADARLAMRGYDTRTVSAVPLAALAPKLSGLGPATPFVEAYVCQPVP